jgi:hypothetical protein
MFHIRLLCERQRSVDACRMVPKRALAASIMAPIGNHSSRATSESPQLRSQAGACRLQVGPTSKESR